MIIPIYDKTVLPCILSAMTNQQEETKRFQGGYAIIGETTATINILIKNNDEMLALKNFWDVDCNYGLEPFVIPLPIFGQATNDVTPAILAQFVGNFSANKKSILWEQSITLNILGEVYYIIDDNGDFILSDTGDFIIINDTLVATNNNITYKGITYGS